MNPAHTLWTRGEVAEIIVGIEDGLSAREVSGMLCTRTRDAVAAKARKLGLAFPVTDEKLRRTCNRFREAREALQAQREMAAAMRSTA